MAHLSAHVCVCIVFHLNPSYIVYHTPERVCYTVAGTGIAYHLPNTKSDSSNLAIFQLTANLPFSTEVVFLGGQSDVQKTIRGPVVQCQGCGDLDTHSKAEPQSIADRLGALTGESACAAPLHCAEAEKGL